MQEKLDKLKPNKQKQVTLDEATLDHIKRQLAENEVARDYVVSSDNKLWALSEIKNIFTTTCRRVLADKAKLFYIDSCRGANKIKNDQIDEIAKGSEKKINNLSRFYTHYATTSNYRAYIKDMEGSHLIRAVHKYYSYQFVKNKEVRLSKALYEINRLVEKTSKARQTSEISTSLTCDVRLKKKK